MIPVLWLVLAATKTDGQLVHSNPLAFGSWHALRVNWDKLTAYQSDAIFLWLRNSAVYSFAVHLIGSMWSIILPYVGFFSFVANWTNYFLPYVMLPQSSQFPVQVGLGTLLDNVPQFNPTVGTLAVQRPELALATLLAIIPVLVVFLFSQRFLVAGLLAGATKG